MIEERTSANLRNRTVKGVSWSAVSQFASHAVTWIISIILARLLGPQAYGLIGMTTVFTGFAILFGNLGLGEAIVQRKALEERHLATAFWLNFAVGTFITILVFALAPAIASFYGEPRLVPLTRIISFNSFSAL